MTGGDFLSTRITYTYDPSGQRVSSLYEYFYGGWTDVSYNTYSYDAVGNLVSVEFDDGFDGDIDWLHTLTHDSYGNLLTYRVQQLLIVLDEKYLIDFTTSYTWMCAGI